ncbi:MAG: magnesium transporter [Candidatus Eisenbacteria sp.]|nr:magnesium transporter [Candidatus Eisenbacteria bacterium]
MKPVPGGVRLDFDPAFHDDLLVLIETRNDALIRTLLARLHPADLADALEHLDEKNRSYTFGLIPEGDRPQALAEMEEGARETLLEALKSADIADLIEELPSDDATDLLRDLPDDVAQRVLKEISPAESRKVHRLLEFPEDTAGGIMAVEFVAVPERENVAQAIDRLRKADEELGDIADVFVVDDAGRLSGRLSLRDLLLNHPSKLVGEIATGDVISVPAGMDQEEVAEIVRKYDLAVVPVVDEAECPIGQITMDDILDVYQEEAAEDFARLAGGLQDESPADSVVSVSANRLPWLVLGLLGGVLAAWVISHFTGSLRQALEISFFMPVIASMGGNVGMQSSAVIVRGLATGEIDRANTRDRLVKEILVGLINALLLAAVLWLVVTLWLQEIKLGVVVGISLAFTMAFAAFVGSGVPLLLRRLGIDPALATGPFVTTTNDVLGLSIYLGLTSLLLGWV